MSNAAIIVTEQGHPDANIANVGFAMGAMMFPPKFLAVESAYAIFPNHADMYVALLDIENVNDACVKSILAIAIGVCVKVASVLPASIIPR